MPDTRRLRVQEALFASAVLSTAALSDAAQWRDGGLVAILAALAIGTHLLPVTARGVHISASLVALVLLMALAGPAPAVAVGVAAALLDAARTRPRRRQLVTDLVTCATVPLAGGVAFTVLRDAGVGDVAYALCVAVLFLALMMPEMVRAGVVGVLPWQVAAAVVTATAAYGEARLGIPVIALFACVLLTSQLLLRAVLQAEHQREELARSFSELGAMHRGLLAAMLNTLALRDPMTARHSAAVARYALATAQAAGLSERDQELAHTAGLVHDIGKASFDDALLHSDGPLSDAQWERIRRHPADGAGVLRGVQGYEVVADIVEAHHERWDGRGYPHGSAGEEIPVLARILAVADAYDVMTGRDTYREPVSHAEAVAELRRVAGTQLDARFVDLFIETVERQQIGFAHADDRDLEAELRRPRAVLA